MRVWIAAAWAMATATAACATLRPPSVAELTPETAAPLVAPTRTMKGGKGKADAAYPPDFAVTVKGDGSIVFPQHTLGRIKGSSLVVGGEAVLTVSDAGEVKGVALKHRYRFDAEGALLDDQGHGVRIAPDGGVRGVGGAWHYESTFAWATEDGGDWDTRAWHTLEIVALVMLENMVPEALREGEGKSAGAADGGKDKGMTIRIPPPSEWFK